MHLLSRLTKNNLKSLCLIICIHFVIIGIAYYLIYSYRLDYILPDSSNLVRFDAYWYSTIMSYGYEFVPGQANNLAFFPLFPLLWDIIGGSAIAISVINAVIFCLSIIYLIRVLQVQFYTVLLIISLPSFIFFALPYSESLFFLFSTLIVAGYNKRSNGLIYIGLFGASLVRSVCMVFIPAIIICEILNYQSSDPFKLRIRTVLNRIFASLGGLFLAMNYVTYKTGTWFYFIDVQKYWNRHWILPKFPLTTISAERVLGIDGVAFVLGCIAIWMIMKFSTQQFIKQRNRTNYPPEEINQANLFSMLYLAAMTILDTGFTLYDNGSTNIWSLNRHILCTPFAITFIVYFYDLMRPGKYELIAILAFVLLGIFFTGVFKYVNINVLLYYTLFFTTFFITKYYKSANWLMICYYLFASLLQIQFYNGFLSNQWLG